MNSQSKFRFDGKTVPLASLCIEIVDCHHSTPNWTEDGKLVIRNFNIRNGRLHLDEIFYTDEETFKERIRRSKPEPGDLIITREAPMGEVCIIPDNVECCLGQRMVLIKPDSKKVSSKYLLYALQSEFVQKQIQKSDKTGSIVSNLRIPVLEELLIPSFDIKIEQRIGGILDAIVSKIELNNRINAELEAMAKIIYDYWFVQFDFPDKEGKPYKASGGKMMWSDELKREIPEGWRAGTLSEISDLVRGVSYSANDIKDKNEQDVVPILRATNISGNVIDLQNMVYVPSEFVSDKQVLDKFDILITMSSGSKDHIGKNGFYYFDEHVAFGAFCAKLVAKANYRYYLYSYTQSDFMFATIKNESLGTNINNLNGTMVAGFKLAIPPKELIEKFNLKVESVFEKIGLNIRENQKLTELRDWLLPMLMNGQIKIKDAEYLSSKALAKGEELAVAAEPEVSYSKKKK